MTDLRYPIGKFETVAEVTDSLRKKWIENIAQAPGKIRAAVKGLSPEQLDTPYRPEGWTVRQVVHHLADSHLNAYARFRLALTEDVPTIKPYHEDLWAKLDDARTAPVDISFALLDALHTRWVLLLRSMSPADFSRTFNHPESGVRTLETNLAIYEWHGRHHTAHITSLRERMGWRA
jgi:uncharacterized damage-inducible protein DinB